MNSEKNIEKNSDISDKYSELETFNAVIPTKPRKMKFQKNVSNGKVSKANAFQIQQKLVKNEAKAPVVSTATATKKSEGGCCGDKNKNKVEKKGSAGGSCCQSNEVILLFFLLLDKCNKYI